MLQVTRIFLGAVALALLFDLVTLAGFLFHGAVVLAKLAGQMP